MKGKTTEEYWNDVWSKPQRLRLPSRLNMATRNVQRLLRSRLHPNTRFLEIGCAPGKLLAWVASVIGGKVSGVDYSPNGIASAEELFAALNLEADLRCENVMETTFPLSSFDLVFSAGVIEHFDDPAQIVRRHVDLTARGGTVLITVPNYGGWMGRLQGRLDPGNLKIHNLGIMNIDALKRLAPPGLASVKAYPWGRFAPGILHLQNAMPRKAAAALAGILNATAMLQPADFSPLAPLLALELRKR